MSSGMERRQFFRLAALLSGGVGGARAAAAGRPSGIDDATTTSTRTRRQDSADLAPDDTPLHWLDGAAPPAFQGVTWGVPWPQGRVASDSGFELSGAGVQHRNGSGNGAAGRGSDGDREGDSPSGAVRVVQSWPLAYWPDGSLKWSAHALPPSAGPALGGGYILRPVTASTAPSDDAMIGSHQSDRIVIDTGTLRCTLARAGNALLAEARRAGKPLLRDGRLVLLVDDDDGDEATTAGGTAATATRRIAYESEIRGSVLEQNGAQRAVVRIDGTHRSKDGASMLPFVVRLYFYRGSDAIRIVHTLTYDADPNKAFVRGVGLRFHVPLAGAPHDRHVRFTGANGGVFAEAVRGLTGLRRDAGAAGEAQLAGEAADKVAGGLPSAVAKGLSYIPAFGQYTLLQAHPDGYTISKRTGGGRGWVHAASGARAGGSGYLGTPDGGVAFGIRNFWQSYPGQIDIRDADADLASVTLWLWAPRAPAMDLRFYHDGMGENDHAKQRDALDITYEDYEPGFGTPYGVARTSELELQLLPATPCNEAMAAIGRRMQTPPLLTASPQRLHAAGVFSEFWAPGTPAARKAAQLERQLDWCFDFYRNQVEYRRWYGYWDYGDVMHTYDRQRHMWRYDVGGFAWDNSELSTEVWLWHYYLHSGRADAYRMAEAMTRHTGEVDVHHIGPFSPLGTRHGVQHWGDSAKQLRVSTAINRRFLYYLSADERVGDLLREQVDAVARLRDIVPGRKVGQKAPDSEPDTHASVAFGTDWGAVAAAWYTEWERSGKPEYRDKLLNSMASIAAQPLGFLAGGGVMDLRSGAYLIDPQAKISVSHLSAVFGLPEICSELIRTVPQPAFRDAWLRYCRLYNATPAQQKAELGQDLGKLNLGQGHARLLGYAAVQQQDAAMLARAWAQFEEGKAGLRDRDLVARRVQPPLVLNEVEEAPTLSTNAVAQWGLGALGMLALDAAGADGAELVRDDFRRFDARSWAVEAEAGDAPSAARAEAGALLLDARRGLTVWLRRQLLGHYEISFTRTVLADGRLSDLNFFWEAQLPQGFTRSGKLEEYDRLKLFYAGIGGNSNSTTRFRYYDGSGERKLLREYTSSEYMLRAGQAYRIRIAVDARGTRLYVDDKEYFNAPGPLAGGGYFGLRTTQSRQKVENFVVRRIA
ncbi:exo-rhamnogalacturonan lyase family protein [Duganella callida]|uniref:exo-rhamnogalacturonan lyase family protein n=1 Tax=Duganella callida TaxID=2561932 RepID=UPI00197AD1E7|nr:DUF6250 domain-containing protein [Duganella callida]